MRDASGITFERLTTALFFLAVATAACLMPAQNDTWWQLRAGRDAIASGIVPLRDSYSHTVNGGYWPNHEWLAQVVFYSVYEAGGLPALTAFAAAVVSAAWAVVWNLTPGSPRTRLILSALALAPFATEWSLRPQIFTLLCTSVTTWLLVTKRYFWLPPLFAVWANLHGGVMLGGMVVASHGIASAVSERRLFTKPMLAGGLCALATCATPLGVSVWTEVPAMLDRLHGYGVSEWQPPSIGDASLLTFWMMVAAFAVLAFRRGAWRGDPARSVTFWGSIALFPAALNASRNVPVLLLAMVPALGMLLSGTLLPWDRPSRRELPALNAALLSGACLAAAATIVLAWSAPAARLGWNPLNANVIAAVETCPDAIYNRFDDGGYLIWFVRGRRVFIDSRQDPYPPELVREHIRVEATGDYRKLFADHRIRCAFGPPRTLLARRLTADGWRPVYQDDRWTVLTAPTLDRDETLARVQRYHPRR